MLEPYEGRVFDPCCGSGGMFVQSEKFIKAHQDHYKKNNGKNYLSILQIIFLFTGRKVTKPHGVCVK